MPKDEFDFEDPFELNGMAMMTHEDTTNDMAECFIEEFMRLGYNHKQVLALFHNPFYVGPNMALEKRGEAFIRDLITEVFARWGKEAVWSSGFSQSDPSAPVRDGTPNQPSSGRESDCEKPAPALDPMGAPIPDITL